MKSIEAQIAASLVGDNPALTPEMVTLLEQKWGAVDRRLVMGTSFGEHLLSVLQMPCQCNSSGVLPYLLC